MTDTERLKAILLELRDRLGEIEQYCPCGARPESLNTHPHVIGCPVRRSQQIASAAATYTDAIAAEVERHAALPTVTEVPFPPEVYAKYAKPLSETMKDAALPTPEGDPMRHARITQDAVRQVGGVAQGIVEKLTAEVSRLTQQLHEAQQEREHCEQYHRPGLPRVQGRCPSCGSSTLFLSRNGYVTCSLIGCENPGAPTDALKPADQAEAALTQARAEGRREALEGLRREFKTWQDIEKQDHEMTAVYVLQSALNSIKSKLSALATSPATPAPQEGT